MHTLGLIYMVSGPISFAEPGVKPHYAPSRVARIEHIALKLDFEPRERAFSGEATVRFSPLPAFQGKLFLDLDEVTVTAVTDAEGAPLPWRLDDASLAIEAGDARIVCVWWRGAEPERGLYFTGPTPAAPTRDVMAWTQCQDEDGHFVFPCHDHPGIKHPWTIELSGPAGFTLLSNGHQVDQGERDGRSWARFEQSEPMPAYLLTAVCARLDVVVGQQSPVPVRYLVPTGRTEHVDRAMGKTPAMIAHFADRLGVAFPWPRYDQVVVDDFIFGGMENIACTTMTDLLLVDEKGALEWDPDGLVAHELAHQWFGDLVTCQDWSQGWLNESWATYLEAVWWEHDRDAAEAEWYRWDAMQGYLAEASGRYRRPIVSYQFREPIDVFDRHLYNKGSCVLWTLRAELGDEAFWSGVQRYLTTNAHQNVHTRDFQRALEQASGQNLDGFFDQFLHHAGHAQLEVTLAHEKGLLTVDVQQQQTGDDVPQAYSLTLTIEVVLATGARQTVKLPVTARSRTFALVVEGDVRTVRVDPGLGLLATIAVKAPRGWLVALLADASPTVAVRAARALLEQGSKPALDAVVAAMSAHPFHGVRSALAELLAKRAGIEAQRALLNALGSEQDPRVKRHLVGALGAFRHEDVATALIGLLDGDLPTWQLHGWALNALGRTRDARAVSVLREHLSVDSWADTVRGRALVGLAATERAEVLLDLLDHTRDSHEDRVRAAAAGALGALADKQHDTRPAVVERLIELLAEPGFRTQLSAIAALTSLRVPEAIGALTRVHRSAPDGRTRRMAYEALVRTREGKDVASGVSALRARVDELADENRALRSRIDKLDVQR